MEANHGPAPGPHCVDAEDVEDDVPRDGEDIASIADQNTALAVDRHLAVRPVRTVLETLAPKQCGGSSVSAFSPPRPVPGIIVTASDATNAMIIITAHDLDQGEAGASIRWTFEARLRRRSILTVRSLRKLRDAEGAHNRYDQRTDDNTSTTIIVAGPIAPINLSRPRPSLCS